jgi:hypothetical protein
MLSSLALRREPCTDDPESIATLGMDHDDEAPALRLTDEYEAVLFVGVIRIENRARTLRAAERRPISFIARLGGARCGAERQHERQGEPQRDEQGVLV